MATAKDIVGLVVPSANNESTGRRLVATAPVVVITLKQRTAEEAAQTAADIDAPERKLQGDVAERDAKFFPQKHWRFEHINICTPY